MIKSLIPEGSKILVAPLNWGLGHASRSIPVIRQLLDHHCKVSVASDGDPLLMLKEEFPQLSFYELPTYNINYNFKSFALNMLLQLPKIYNSYKKENRRIEELQKENQWDVIISDARLGVRSSSSKNILINHQLNLQSWNPIGSAFANVISAHYQNRFDEVWVPDYKNHKLSGNLSKSSRIKEAKFIGPQSRLTKKNLPIKYDLGIILSGPEPSRTNLEKDLLTQFSNTDLKIAWVRGIDKEWSSPSDNITVFPRIGSEQLNQIINSSKLIICRTGYTSIMDLDQLNKKAILIPTPGQTEQEYLGKWLADHPLFQILDQRNIDKIKSLLD